MNLHKYLDSNGTRTGANVCDKQAKAKVYKLKTHGKKKKNASTIVTAKEVKPKLDAPLFPSCNPHFPKQKTPLDSLCSVQPFTFKNKKKHGTKVVHMKIKEEKIK